MPTSIISLKDAVYFATIIGGVAISWAKTNASVKKNQREIEVLREMVANEINSEKSMVIQSMNTISEKLDAGFKRIDELKVKTEELEKKSIVHVKQSDLKAHPTREELQDKLTSLQNDDRALKDQITELKKEIKDKLHDLDTKFEDIKSSLFEHAKQEGDKLNHIINLMSKHEK